MNKKKLSGWSAISWDWKSSPTKEELESALSVFGIKVYNDPCCEGSDVYGFIFSKKELSDEDLEEIREQIEGSYDE